MPAPVALVSLLVFGLVTATLSLVAAPARAAVVIRVPEDYATISAAIAAASPGDVIDIASGTYTGQITLSKAVTLKGRQGDPADPNDNTTILRADATLDVIVVPSNVSPAPTITGLVLRDGLSGVSLKSPVTIEGNTFINNNDQLDYKIGGGGIARGNLMQTALDDGIDINHPVRDISVIGNTIVGSGGDGVEMRLNDDVFSTTARILFRANDISGSRSDGIQIIDYYTDTNRVMSIERNLIHDNGRAGIGLLDDAMTAEDYRAASIRERITVINNTLVRNNHGISGGDNLFALNNIFLGHVLALKNVDGGSIASHNLFWQNTTNQSGSNVEASILGDPLLDASYRLRAGSPAIDAGVAHFERTGEVIWDEPSSNYTGSAPDLGWLESAAPTGGGQPPTVTSVSITPSGPRTNTLLTANATATDPDGDAVSFTYQWRKNGSALPGATGRTLDLSVAGNGDKGDAISVTVTASDGASSSAPSTSSAVTILNSEPAFRADLGDRSSVEGTAISLSAAATDADGDPLTYAATGLPPGLSIGATTGTISGTIASGATGGSPYAVSVTVRDGTAVDATDTFAWTVTPPGASGIVFHAASGVAYASRSAVPIPRPAGVAAGDVLTASILVVGPASVTPPPGWTPVRTDANGTAFRQFLYVRVAGATEPSTYRFVLSQTSKAAGTLAAYGGVDAAAPVASAGQANAASTSITAPSIPAQRAGDLVVGFFGIVPSVMTQIAPPPGMTERLEVAPASGSPRPALELSDAALVSAGDTGVRVATSSVAGASIGQVVVLRAA